MSVRVGWTQRALLFSVKLSNANPVSTWLGERLTLPSTADFSCFFFFFFFFFCCCFVVVVVVVVFCCCFFLPIHFFLSSFCHSQQ